MFPGFELFGKFIHSYMLCSLAGIFTACPFGIYMYKKRAADNIKADVEMIFLYLFSAIGVFIGMHLLYGITNIGYWGLFSQAKDFWQFIQLVGIIFGGGVFYGGLLGGMAAGMIYIRTNKLPAGLMADCAAPSIALFHAWGRIGCFLGGCCYGVEWEHGVTFTDALSPEANGVPRVPVQLYEAGLELALFLVLWLLLRKNMCRGRLLPIYLISYSAGRFLLEFLRGDEYRGALFGLSTSQLIAIIVVVITTGILVSGGLRKEHKSK